MTEFSPIHRGSEVPDPYCEGLGAFENVLDILEDSCEGLMTEIEKRMKEEG
jgi:protein-tyrosine phosphatase